VVYPRLWISLWRTGVAVRILLALLMGAIILALGVAWLRSLTEPAPVGEEPAEVSDQNLKYVCTMCGLELRLEKATGEKAPTHCMESMVLIREGGKPPLRPA
jgi:DNA-directed RNA polymerase subunit RPC12/RpoP